MDPPRKGPALWIPFYTLEWAAFAAHVCLLVLVVSWYHPLAWQSLTYEPVNDHTREMLVHFTAQQKKKINEKLKRLMPRYHQRSVSQITEYDPAFAAARFHFHSRIR